MNRHLPVLLCISCLALASNVAIAQDLAASDPYTLLNPKPRELWRPLSADRPDFTESPFTVDPGAVQLEMSFFDYTRNGSAETLTIAPVNLKLGLLDDVDLQLVFDPYVHDDDTTQTRDGIGDSQVRLKINFWGNDGGATAFAFMPFIKIPTASSGLGNDHAEGGLIFPFATDLTDSIGLGLMFETDFVYDATDDGYDTEFVTTGVLGFDLSDDVGVYVEGIGIASTDSATDFRALFGTGVTYAARPDLVFDVGVNFGLTGDADDVNIFAGVTLRF